MRKRRFRPLKPFIGDKISQVVGYKISPIREMYYNYADLDEPDVFGVAAEYGDLKQLLIQTLPYIDRNRLTNVNLRVQGKGLTVENAIFSAIGEFLERYALLFPYQESLVFGSYEHLSGKGLIAIDPREIQLFADEQYDLPTFPFKRFTETTEIWWVKGLRLIDAMEVWFPAQLVFHVPLCGDTPIAYATSSGCAAANDLEEAILKGLYELAERDAYMIAWHAKLAQPRIELDDELENLVGERFRSSNVEIRFST